MLWGRKRAEYKTAAVYDKLRNQIFALQPSQIGLTPEKLPAGLWGVVIELGYENGVGTLLALAEGTVSLYFSAGGGSLGHGAHPGPRKAAILLLQCAPKFRELCHSTTEHPLPHKGSVRFYLLTFDGILTAEADMKELETKRHPLSGLYLLGHNLIGEIRMVDEKLKAQAEGKAES